MYDIKNDKLRSTFSKYLKKYGKRVQYSVFEIKNSERLLQNIKIKIKNIFEPKFSQADSVLIYQIGDNSCIEKFGYAINEDNDLIFL